MYCRYCGKKLPANAAYCVDCGVQVPNGNKYCYNCGVQTKPEQDVCLKCGVSLTGKRISTPYAGDKDWLTTLLLAIFVGSLGVHRFYVGKIGTGIAMLFTLGGCGIWTLIDIIMIATGDFKDDMGRPLKKD
ncbi:NINE protein [candidate division WOR-3 bacterium]|uniref:NINE protein n=1 Tax=candidate division WOR-3 bacterium TaxID=2052148 RepID=A0A9D5KAN8_UNCW3|nr:NINE protein [candidate division WOR-3 bacterium]MBD3365393.1 NINE protein [candidate division WOR-3 bacterium]